MKNPTKAVALAAALLLAMTLSACGDDTAAPSGESTSTQSRTQSTESETPEPLVAETSEPSDASESDADFLNYVETERPVNTSIANATDEQLIAAGHEACRQIADGVAYQDLRLVEGEQPSPAGDYLDTSAIFNGALYFLCPEQSVTVD